MEFERCAIPDLVLCKPTVFEDERGCFYESFREDQLNDFLGYNVGFCQDNESKSTKGVLRGMHFQKPPFTQSKLVRVTEGSVLDIVVDMRKGSPTFGESYSVELNAQNKLQLFVPRGFAHGFLVLSETAVFSYKCDNYYSKEHDSGFYCLDESLNLNWKLDNLILSEKDKNLPPFNKSFTFDYSSNLYE